MPSIARPITFAALLLFTTATFAADARQSWLVETMYKSGKINTVIGVVAVVLLGLALWLFRQDRRIARMEREIRK